MTEIEATQDKTEDNALTVTSPFVVGIGASAGGLEAIRELVRSLPASISATYVVVQHMSPQHKSLLTKLISRETQLNVLEVVSGTAPQENTIYVTPPNNDIVYRDGVLQLQSPSTAAAAPTPSIDRFFISLSEEITDRAVGLVLSGTGSDGAYGVQAIRAAGGITIAQDDKSAKYDGMPIAAVETGCIDLVLGPDEIGQHLSKILTLPRSFESLRVAEAPEHPVSDLLQILFARTRVDFREYKTTTVQRRIERRMAALAINDQAEYTNACRSNPREVDALFRDLLISVTRFFRDPEAFGALSGFTEKLVDERQGRTLRVWVAGCATGEEAYSIAIMMAEALGGIGKIGKDVLQIFASDIDSDALRIARAGRYSLAALDDVPAELVSKYFVRYDDGVEVVNAIKQLVLFSDHNVCQDPPFRNVDLVCCRNLLIYFGGALQRKVLTRLNYALNFGGILFLGSAETVAGSETLFKPLSEKMRIFGKRLVTRTFEKAHSDDLINTPRRWSGGAEAETSRAVTVPSPDRAMFDALARAIGRNTLLVSKDLLIIKVYGDIGPYITLNEHSRLQLSANMLKSPFANEARTLVTLAIKNGVRRRGGIHRMDGFEQAVQIEALPLTGSDLEESFALLVFSEVQRETSPVIRDTGFSSEEANEHITMLERELEATREALNQTIEELETSNEELQSLNEELQSTNEELQSLNEELETSNEELQSTNEELVTVNEELQINASEMSVLAEELNSILENIAAPIIVVDSALQVTRVSESAARIFGLSRRTEPPHISQCALPPGFPPLAELFSEALRLGKVVHHEILESSSAYTVFCAPFADVHGKLSGATMILVETQAARLATEINELFEVLPFNFTERNEDGRILRLSGGAASQLGVDADHADGLRLSDVLSPVSAAEVLAADRAFLHGTEARLVSHEQITFAGDTRSRWFEIERYRSPPGSGNESTLYAIATDISKQRVMAMELALQTRMIALSAEIVEIGYWSINLGTGITTWSDRMYTLHGGTPGETLPDMDTALARYHPEDRQILSGLLETARDAGQGFDTHARLTTGDGTQKRVRVLCQYLEHETARLLTGAVSVDPG